MKVRLQDSLHLIILTKSSDLDSLAGEIPKSIFNH